jgi:hypothetical protein
MSTSSIAGNENFTLVENAAGQFQSLNVSYQQATEMKVESITVGDENFAKEVVGLGTVYTVTGYAPTTFGTTAATAGVFLNIQPNNLPATSATSSQLLHLPTGAEIIGMRITNNGTPITSAGAPTLSIANQAWSASAPAGTTLANLTSCGAGAATGVNSPAGVKFWPAAHIASATGTFDYPSGTYPEDQTQAVTVTVTLPRMTLGTAGEDQATAAAGVAVTATTREVGVLVNTAALTAGDLAVKLWYIAPTEIPGDRP